MTDAARQPTTPTLSILTVVGKLSERHNYIRGQSDAFRATAGVGCLQSEVIYGCELLTHHNKGALIWISNRRRWQYPKRQIIWNKESTAPSIRRPPPVTDSPSSPKSFPAASQSFTSTRKTSSRLWRDSRASLRRLSCIIYGGCYFQLRARLTSCIRASSIPTLISTQRMP